MTTLSDLNLYFRSGNKNKIKKITITKDEWDKLVREFGELEERVINAEKTIEELEDDIKTSQIWRK